MESGDSCSGLSVTIARSQAAALAENAAYYSSFANIGRYQLGSGPAERTRETLTGGEAISTIASTLRRITACAVAIDRSPHLIQYGVARRAAVGKSPHQYVSGHRLERAKELLTRGNQSPLDIAIALNFSSQANFTRAFHKGTGMTPWPISARFQATLTYFPHKFEVISA
jgi:hypothetical protein